MLLATDRDEVLRDKRGEEVGFEGLEDVSEGRGTDQPPFLLVLVDERLDRVFLVKVLDAQTETQTRTLTDTQAYTLTHTQVHTDGSTDMQTDGHSSIHTDAHTSTHRRKHRHAD